MCLPHPGICPFVFPSNQANSSQLPFKPKNPFTQNPFVLSPSSQNKSISQRTKIKNPRFSGTIPQIPLNPANRFSALLPKNSAPKRDRPNSQVQPLRGRVLLQRGLGLHCHRCLLRGMRRAHLVPGDPHAPRTDSGKRKRRTEAPFSIVQTQAEPDIHGKTEGNMEGLPWFPASSNV